MRILFLSFSFLVLSINSFASDFQADFRSYRNVNQLAQVGSLPQFEYVFVAGFLNEGLVGYFAENIAALQRAGIPRDRIHVLKPSSGRGVLANLPSLTRDLQRIYQSSGRQLVIIAHSKGALETLALVVSHSKLFLTAVKRVYLVQGALGGSGVADYISGSGPEADRRMPLTEWLWFKAMGRSAKLLDRVINKGIAALTHSNSRKLWNDLLKKHGRPSAELSEKVKYIAGAEHPSRMAEAVDCTGWYLHTQFGLNDGLVAVRDQYFQDFGQLLGILEADHADLMTPRPISNTPASVRYGLMYAILKNLQN